MQRPRRAPRAILPVPHRRTVRPGGEALDLALPVGSTLVGATTSDGLRALLVLAPSAAAPAPAPSSPDPCRRRGCPTSPWRWRNQSQDRPVLLVVAQRRLEALGRGHRGDAVESPCSSASRCGPWPRISAPSPSAASRSSAPAWYSGQLGARLRPAARPPPRAGPRRASARLAVRLGEGAVLERDEAPARVEPHAAPRPRSTACSSVTNSASSSNQPLLPVMRPGPRGLSLARSLTFGARASEPLPAGRGARPGPRPELHRGIPGGLVDVGLRVVTEALGEQQLARPRARSLPARR